MTAKEFKDLAEGYGVSRWKAAVGERRKAVSFSEDHGRETQYREKTLARVAWIYTTHSVTCPALLARFTELRAYVFGFPSELYFP